MHGKIEFETIGQLAEFLKCFEGSTCEFLAYPKAGGMWEIEFKGQY